MKCKKTKEDCALELKFLKNGDIFEFCNNCDFSVLHHFENIKNNHLSPHKQEN